MPGVAANTAYMGAMYDIASRVQLLKADYILPIHGFGQEGKLLYLSMPLMYESLRSILQRTGDLPLYRAVALLRQIATGLAAAHAADIIHRDLKPENVLLNVAGQGFVSDFGVGRDLSPESVERRSLGTLSSLIGTPAYMAPEQLRGQPADQPTSGPMSMRSASSSMRCLPAHRPTAAIRSTMSRRRRSPPPPRDACPNTPHHWASEYAVPDRDPQADLTARAKADRHARARPHRNRDGNHFSHSDRYANAMRI